MSRRIVAEEVVGKQFGQLRAVRVHSIGARGGSLEIECVCGCGGTTIRMAYNLLRGTTKSCGCLSDYHVSARKKRLPKSAIAKSGKRTQELDAYHNMIARCFRKTHRIFRLYGGRGITVCDRWRLSFENFFADVGPRPSPKHSLDRYPDKNCNYEPGNIRWATATEQSRNTSRTPIIEFRGEMRNVFEWAEVLGFDCDKVRSRMRHGWTFERAISQPHQFRK